MKTVVCNGLNIGNLRGFKLPTPQGRNHISTPKMILNREQSGRESFFFTLRTSLWKQRMRLRLEQDGAALAPLANSPCA